MCDCFHLAFPNWHAASSGTGPGRRLRGPEPVTEDDSICDEPSQFTEGERPRPQGSSPVEEYPEKYSDSDKECEAEHDPQHKSGIGKKTKKSGLGSMFEKRSTPKMSKLKEVHSPESGVIVKTAKDGCAEGLIYGGGGKEGIFIKQVVPESPASKSLKLKEGDQILSATVYFDNVSYEDAIQILEHAQAYKVKLCLKRKPDITETEPTLDSDVIPEEELYAPEMREQGKTKRRGDARISWPKFPSFGKGRKSHFTRSHSSSEADEQRKLELSPTTSDTESPIKSQDALKGKKRHKMKLSVLTKRGRISSSEDQETDVPTTGQTSADNYQTASDMLSPECFESLSGETPEVHLTEDLKVDDLRLEENDQKLPELQSGQHRVELISIDSTLKTADLTVALADQESPSGIKSPNEKRKKKKERSELKMKILGKDKSPKKDAKGSPKRLKTLGASIETADQPQKSDVSPGFELQTEPQGDQLQLDVNTQIIGSESSRAKSVTTQMEMSVPKVELDISDATFIQKSPKKSDEKTKKGKDLKQKQEKKTSPAFKLPKIGLSDIATEETIQKTIVEECPAKMKPLKSEGAEVKEDAYDKLSKGNLSRTQLPKREEIEIPGMEDMSVRTTAKRIKVPKATLTGHYEEIQSETVQLSIDVDSVKEAVSKLPGFKLPKVDTSGVPIPEEITVIDANAQRISVKTPTKVVDTKTKHEAHFSKFDITASPEISKTTVKLPKITTADLTSYELLTETKVDLKRPEKEYKIMPKQSDKEMKTEIYKREDIIIPGKESAQEEAMLQAQKKKTKITASFGISKPVIKIPDLGIDLPKQNMSEQKRTIQGERSIDSIEYIDSGGSPAKKGGGIRITGFGADLDATRPKADISFPEIRGEVKDVGAEKHTIKLAKFGVTTDISANVPDADMDISIDGADIKMLETEEQGSKFKMPNLGISMPKMKGPKVDLSLSKTDVTSPEAKAKVKFQGPETDIALGNVDISISQQKMEVEKPDLEIKPLQAEGELDGQGSKFKMPKLGIKMPKIKGPEFDLTLSKKDVDVKLPDAKAEIKLPDAPGVDVTPGSVDVSIPEYEMDVEKPAMEIKPLQTEVELDGQGSKFKMPKFGIKMPKIKGPEFDLSLSEKDVDVTLPEAKAEVKLPDAPEVDVTLGGVDVSIPEKKIEVDKPELEMQPLQTKVELDGQGSKFKMPKFGIKMPKIKGPEFDLKMSKKDVDITLPEAKPGVKLPDAPEVDITLRNADVSIPEKKIEVGKPEMEMQPLQTEVELDGQGSKFKMPKFGIKMPKIKGPEFDLKMSKTDVDVKLPEAKAGVKLPDAPEVDVTLGSVDVSIPEQMLEVEKPELKFKPLQTDGEIDGQGSKFKMPKLGITMPKVKGPEIDFSSSKKEVDLTLPEAKAEVKLPDVELKDPSGKVEIKAPEIKGTEKDAEGSPSKFKMPTFKLPKFGAAPRNVNIEVSSKTKDIQIPETQLKSPDGIAVDIKTPNIDIEGPSLDVKTTAAELDGKGSKFKMPKFGISLPKVKGPEIDLSLSNKDVDVTLPEAKAEVKLPDAPEVDVTLGGVDVSIPEKKIEVDKPELEMQPLQTEVELDGQGSKFKMPKFGIKMPKIKGPEFDLKMSKKDVDITLPEAKPGVNLPDAPEVDITLRNADVSIPEKKIEVGKPEMEMQPLQTEVDLDGQGSKFKMPRFGIKMPKIKGPEFDLSLSKKDVNVTLPEAKAEVKLPDAPGVDVTLGGVDVSIPEKKIEVEKPELEMQPLQTEVELDGQGSKFKMPKFGIKMPKIKGPEFDLKMSKTDVDVKLPEAKAGVKLPDAPEVDVTLGSADVSIPEQMLEVEKPELKFKPLQTDGEIDGQGSKFKMPKLGITMPKVKGPEIDFSSSKKEVDLTLPEAKAEVKLPDVDLKDPSGKVEIKAPEIKGTEKDAEGSPSKFKMPTFKLPKFGAAPRNVNIEVSSKTKDIQIPETQLKSPDGIAVDIKTPNIDIEGPSLDVKTTAAELDGKGSKFKMPKFGISLPKVKGPEIDLSLSNKDVDVTLPEAKAEVKLPDAPEVDVTLGGVDVSIPEKKIEVDKPELEMQPLQTEVELDGQGSKFKMPKFGIKMPKIKGPEFDLKMSKKDVDITLPEAKAGVKLPDAPEVDITLRNADVSIPEKKIEVGKPEMEMQPLQTEVELEGQGSKFKMPRFGIKMPKLKGPEFDLSLSKKDVDVTLPEAKAEVKLPDAPVVDVTLGGVDVSIPEKKIEVEKPELEMQPLQTEVEFDGQGSKFKMPKFGIKMPKIKGPEFDLKMSKTDVDVRLPEAKAGVKLPDAPEVDVTLGSVDVSIPEQMLEVEKPELKFKPLQTDDEIDGQGSTFKMPKLGITMPKVKGPEIDFSSSKKEVDLTLPEAKAEVKLPDVELKDPSGKVEIKAPEIKGTEKDAEGSPSKFKMPTFKLPKFGAAPRNVNIEVSSKTKDIHIPETQLKSPDGIAVDIKTPNIDIEGPSLDVKRTATELDGKGSKFKMPKFGISLPKVKGPEIDLSLSKKDVDVTLPEADVKLPDVEQTETGIKVEVKSPEIDINQQDIEGSPSKFKMPTFKLPKFGVGTPKASAEVPEMDKDVKIDTPDIDIPDEGTAINIAAPNIEGPSIDLKTTAAEQDGKGSKFKMPHFGFSMPKVKGPKIDLSLSKKDVDVKLPEAKADVKLPEVDLGEVDVSIPEAKMKVPDAKAEVKLPEASKIAVEMKPPECEVEMDGHGGNFKIPKFGIKMPKVKGPEFDLSLSKKDVDGRLPEVKGEVKLPDAPKADITLGSVDVSIPEQKMKIEKPQLEIKPLQTEIELEGQESKFKMPKFGMSMEKVKEPEFNLDLSKKDVDIKLPETKADINLPDVDLKSSSAKMEIKAPEIDVKEGSPSKFKIPSFSFSMPKVKGPDIDLSLSKKQTDIAVPDTKAEVKLPEAPKIDVSLGKAEVLIPDTKVEVKKPEIQIRQLQTDAELDGQGGKFKLPKFGMAMPKVKGPEIDLSLSKKDIDVTLPEGKAEVKLPDVELKDPSAKVEMKDFEIKAQLGHVEGSPSKFKLPTFKLPKFVAATPHVSTEVPDMDRDIKVDGAGLEIPKDSTTVKISAQDIDIKGPSLDVKMTGTEGKGIKFKVPKFGISLPKVQGPEIDSSFSKKDVDVKLPEAKAEVKLPEAPDVSIPEAKMEVKKPEFDEKGGKFKMPKFGMSMPKVKGPEIDLSLSKKDVDITLPEGTAEVNLPDVEVKEPSANMEVKAPEIQAQLSSAKGSPSKFKLPTFNFPKFGVATPNISAELPDADKEIKIDGAHVQISAPHIDVDVPEVKAEVTLPEEPSGVVVTEQQPGVEVDAKLKKPRFSLPSFSFSKPNVKTPEVDVSPQDINVEIPEGKVEVKGGEVAMKPPEIEAEVDKQGKKFKMPKFGITMPKVSGPEIDLSLSKKDVDVTLPEAKAKLPDVELKEPSAEVEIKAPEIKVATKDKEGSPSKFKMPTFKLPKFGVGTRSSTVEEPVMDKNLKIDGDEEVLAVSIAAPSIDTQGPSIHMKTTGTEYEGKGSKFKLPSLGFSGAQVKGPDVALSLSKKDVDVTLPEVKTDVKLPDVELKEPPAKVDIKDPVIEVQTSNIEGSPSKFKMPSFKLPKFGAPQISVEVPEVEGDIKVDGADLKLPEAKAAVKLPDIEIKEPVVSVSASEPPMSEGDANARKTSWTLPRFSFSKTSIKGPEADLNLDTPKVDVALPEAKTEIHPPDVDIKVSSSISVEGAPSTDIDTKLKKPKFSLPKFSFSKQSTKELEVDVSLPDAAVSLPEGNVEVKSPEVDLKPPEGDIELDGQGSKFKMPKFGIALPKVKGPEIDLNLSKKDSDVTLPETKAEVQLPDVKTKQLSAKVEIKAPEIEAQTGKVETSPSKLKMPTFTLPKFGAATPKVSVQVPEVDKDIQIEGAKLQVTKEGAAVDVTAPSIDTAGHSVDIKAKGSDLEGSGSKFKMPHLGISKPKVKGPEIDLTLSKKGVDATLQEAKAEVTLPSVEIKEPEGAISVPDTPTVEVEVKSKRPNWTFPKFSFSRTGGKVPDVDENLETPKVDVTTPEVKVEVCVPDVEVKGPSGVISVEELPAEELDANLKKSKFSLPRFSFSKASVTVPEVSAEPPHVDISLPEGEVKVRQPAMEMKAPELEAEHVQGNKFKLPKFGIALPKPKGPEVDLKSSQRDVDVTLPGVKAEVKLPEVHVKESSASVETEAKSKDVGGSPLKFKMPTLKMPKLGVATYDVTVEGPDADKAETTGAEPKEDVAVSIKSPSIEIKTDMSKTAISDSETQKIETDGAGLGSPSKFKLPSFKMPKLSFSRAKPEDEHAPDDNEDKEVQLKMEVEPQEETKSPKLTLTSFSEIFKNIDVEFDVSKTDKEEENLEISKEIHETGEPSGKELEAKDKETNKKQDTTKSPERTGWFKFPRFGLSSPSEPAKISEKDEHKDEKSPVGETGDEEISPTCSVQSSDAFADISSTMTSEHVGLSLSSPTKVTVKYTGPDVATGFGEIHSNIITSTTSTGLISVEPNLPEKITILSSGVSSSSDDTLRLESGKIHVITSNIQAIPEAQHAKLVTAVQIQSSGGLPLESEANKTASWTVEDTQSTKRSVFGRYFARETSSERSESKETIVITKQITHTSEPISGETASSIQRLRDSVHSEKMRFFDGAEK